MDDLDITPDIDVTQEIEDTTDYSLLDAKQIAFFKVCKITFDLKHGSNKIGSHLDCDIILPYWDISKVHIVIVINSMSDIKIMNCDLTNKTLLRGEILKAYLAVPLKNNDTVQFGSYLGVFEINNMMLKTYNLPPIEGEKKYNNYII